MRKRFRQTYTYNQDGGYEVFTPSGEYWFTVPRDLLLEARTLPEFIENLFCEFSFLTRKAAQRTANDLWYIFREVAV